MSNIFKLIIAWHFVLLNLLLVQGRRSQEVITLISKKKKKKEKLVNKILMERVHCMLLMLVYWSLLSQNCCLNFFSSKSISVNCHWEEVFARGMVWYFCISLYINWRFFIVMHMLILIIENWNINPWGVCFLAINPFLIVISYNTEALRKLELIEMLFLIKLLCCIIYH